MPDYTPEELEAYRTRHESKSNCKRMQEKIMSKKKQQKFNIMQELDEALHQKFKRKYITEWNVINGAYVTTVIEKGTDLMSDRERIFIDGYMAAVNDCMYGGALK